MPLDQITEKLQRGRRLSNPIGGRTVEGNEHVTVEKKKCCFQKLLESYEKEASDIILDDFRI